VFLHVAGERRADVLVRLTQALADMALVMPVDAAIAEGLFGTAPVGEELRARLGDIVILPYPGYFIWWREPRVIGNTFHGHHGGLAREELITALGAIDAL